MWPATRYARVFSAFSGGLKGDLKLHLTATTWHHKTMERYIASLGDLNSNPIYSFFQMYTVFHTIIKLKHRKSRLH